MGLKLGIALGGGGVRGLANIGAIRALSDAGIIPDVIAGTSMGAIVGAMFADTLDIAGTQEIICGTLSSEEFRKKARRLSTSSDSEKGFFDQIYGTAKKGYFFYRFLFMKSMIPPEAFFTGMDGFIPDKDFSELRRPFACMALDIVSGYPEILRSGSVRQAVQASSSVPGMLPPVQIGASRYVDGGWAERVPVSAARFLGADFVLGIDVSRDIAPLESEEQIKNSMDVLFRADDIARALMNTLRVREADFVVYPEVGDAKWSDFDNIDEYISAGYRAMAGAVPALKKAMRVRRIKGLLWKRRSIS
ncbi:MAG TPA: patatin-like phospholipase family protein [Deltaproteobacteria bacterium]|nr:patatin-like phospholipase family protein [Pseudomonadota bacterium]HON62738.1 patatin-like phospholipase family protein [Deltaproteobacteria bacterium]